MNIRKTFLKVCVNFTTQFEKVHICLLINIYYAVTLYIWLRPWLIWAHDVLSYRVFICTAQQILFHKQIVWVKCEAMTSTCVSTVLFLHHNSTKDSGHLESMLSLEGYCLIAYMKHLEFGLFLLLLSIFSSFFHSKKLIPYCMLLRLSFP